jgi:DNA-binding XRE family transcriptional regulator
LKTKALAKFAGLSRLTINQLENGTLKDLDYTKRAGVAGSRLSLPAAE